MIDAYYWGQVDRISPEAPVPIVSVEKKDNRMGGAANVAINLKALGAIPYIATVLGNDEGGFIFSELLKKRELPATTVIKSEARKTTIKTRIIGNNQQVLRVDNERIEQLSTEDNEALKAAIFKLLDANIIDVVVFEDYDKGVLNENLIQSVIQKCKHLDVPKLLVLFWCNIVQTQR